MRDTPITFNHDYHNPPIGKVEFIDDKAYLKFRKSANITEDMINGINGKFGPTYIIKKQENGVILEAELVALSIISKQHGSLR